MAAWWQYLPVLQRVVFCPQTARTDLLREQKHGDGLATTSKFQHGRQARILMHNNCKALHGAYTGHRLQEHLCEPWFMSFVQCKQLRVMHAN
jgi:hypothetical protein